MCIFSAVGDQYKDDFWKKWPNVLPQTPGEPIKFEQFNISRSEFNALKKEVEELKTLLLAAKKFDEATGQKDCQMQEKIEFIGKLAEFLGVDMSNVFGENK